MTFPRTSAGLDERTKQLMREQIEGLIRLAEKLAKGGPRARARARKFSDDARRAAATAGLHFPVRTSGMHDMTFGDLRTLRERHDHGDCPAHCSICATERAGREARS